MNARRGFVGRLTWLGWAAVLTLACSGDKKTLLLVDVSLQTGLTPPTSVTIDVSAAGVPVGSADFDWSTAKNGILQTGTYLPEGVAGAVTVTATGKTGGLAQSRASAEDINLLADKTNGPFRLSLSAIEIVGDSGVNVTPDAGAPDTSGDPGDMPDAALPSPEDAPVDSSEDDVSVVGLDDAGVDASVTDVSKDANLELMDAPDGEVLGDGGGSGDLGSEAGDFGT